MIIYNATNIINGKEYIGKSVVSLEKRKKRHLKCAFNGSSLCFHKAIRKYGESNFTWLVLRKCKTKKELSAIEVKYIKKHNTYKGNGYNMTPGGEGGHGECSEETKQKIRESKIGNKNPMYKVGRSDDTKKKMSLSRRGKDNSFYNKKNSKKSRKKMSKSHTGKKRPKHSPETRSKISLSLKGEHNPQSKLKKKDVIKIKQMLYVRDLCSRQIAEQFNVSRSTIDKIKHGKTWQQV